MVAVERRKFSELEDELREMQAEREALRSALRLVSAQQQNQNRVNQGTAATATTTTTTTAGIVGLDSMMPSGAHAHTNSMSSAMAIKSPPSSRPSSLQSARPTMDDEPLSSSSANAIEPGWGGDKDEDKGTDGEAGAEALSSSRPSPHSSISPTDTIHPSSLPSSKDASNDKNEHEREHEREDEEDKDKEFAMFGSSSLTESPDLGFSSPEGFLFSPSRPISFEYNEESPWAS